METIDFNQVIQENISVVEELIGKVTRTKNGLMPKDGFFTGLEIKSIEEYSGTLPPGIYSKGTINIGSPSQNRGSSIIVFKSLSYNVHLEISTISMSFKTYRPDGSEVIGYEQWKSVSFT